MVGLVLALLALGFPVAFAFLGANVIGVWLFMGGSVGVDQLLSNGAASVYNFLLVAIPLFIVMGELFFHSGLSQRAFDALDKLFGGIPGRLSYITIAGGTIFAMLSGSSLASGAMLGSVMVPEGIRRGYKKHIVIGPIMGAGGLAILIPPSALMVLLGSIGQIDVGSLLLAGVIPGFLLAALYVGTVYVNLKIDPAAAPNYAVERVPLLTKLRIVFTELVPFGLVIFAVVGTIIVGIATPSEAAAFGVLAVVVLMVVYGCFSWNTLVKSLDSAMRISVMVFIIIVGSSTFSQILAFTGATSGLVEWATSYEIPPYVMVAVMVLVLLVFGMFIDAISIMLLTVPIFLPIIHQIGFDAVLFGVILMVTLEIGAITPPFGLLLFVMQGVVKGVATQGEIVMASLPYLGCAVLLIVLLMVFPDIALLLPRVAR
jgi:tripartite ATP-independent transporter DctM subunit